PRGAASNYHNIHQSLKLGRIFCKKRIFKISDKFMSQLQGLYCGLHWKGIIDQLLVAEKICFGSRCQNKNVVVELLSTGNNLMLSRNNFLYFSQSNSYILTFMKNFSKWERDITGI